MKYLLSIIGIIILVSSYHLFAKGASEQEIHNDTLTIISYDSFVSEWGLGPQIQEIFTEQYGYRIEFVTYGDAVETFNTLKNLDASSSDYPDLMIGIDNNMAYTVLSSDVFRKNKLDQEVLSTIPSNLFLDSDYVLVPFDYGYISIVYNSNIIQAPPTSLEDLVQPQFENSLILIDPRSSSTGLAFFLWTIDVYGDDFLDYWKRLKPSILSVPNAWPVAYGMFTAGEAPLVLSYTTSPVYHIEYEETTHIKSTIFEEGNYLQIEYAGITKNAPNPKAAETFIRFMLSSNFQDKVALTNIMYPVKTDVPLPQSFSHIEKPPKELSINPSDIPNETWLSSKIEQWEEVMATK